MAAVIVDEILTPHFAIGGDVNTGLDLIADNFVGRPGKQLFGTITGLSVVEID